MKNFEVPDQLNFGPWHARRDTGALVGALGSERLEPKVMELLLLLGAYPDRVFSKEELMQNLWPNLILGDDTLARTVSKLRKALGDDARTPKYIETLPKRGYRFVRQADPSDAKSAPSPEADPKTASTLSQPRRPVRQKRRAAWAASIGLVAVLVAFSLKPALQQVEQEPRSADLGAAQILIDRANDFYFQYTRADNEAAIELFERVIAVRAEAAAYAGLANALAQLVLRWPDEPPYEGKEFTKLGDALASGHLLTPGARAELQRAHELAERAVELAPNDPVALKALGFVRSVREDFPGALTAYRTAIALDPDAWGPMINMADILEISGHTDQAMPYLEDAFAAMGRVYPAQTARVRPWYAETALLIANHHARQQRPIEAEHWLRRALEIAPFHVDATTRLAQLLHAKGRAQEADDLCARLRRRVGDSIACAQTR